MQDAILLYDNIRSEFFSSFVFRPMAGRNAGRRIKKAPQAPPNSPKLLVRYIPMNERERIRLTSLAACAG